MVLKYATELINLLSKGTRVRWSAELFLLKVVSLQKVSETLVYNILYGTQGQASSGSTLVVPGERGQCGRKLSLFLCPCLLSLPI